MVRLEARVEYDFFMGFANKFLSGNTDVEHFEKFKMLDYRHNFRVFNDDNLFDEKKSFYLGYIHNTEKPGSSGKKKYKLVIEFNPNKMLMDFGLLNTVLSWFFCDVDNVKFVSCDICTDFEGIAIDSVIVDKGSKRTFIDYQKNGGRGLYIGKRGSNGQVKVYDKAKELGLKDKVLTRWEGHFTFEHLYLNMVLAQGFVIDECLPRVSFPTGEQVDVIDDLRLRCVVECVRNGFVRLDDFEKRYRQKIRKCLENTSYTHIDNASLKDLRTTIISFFIDYYNVFCCNDGKKLSQDLIKKDSTKSVEKVESGGNGKKKTRAELMAENQLKLESL